MLKPLGFFCILSIVVGDVQAGKLDNVKQDYENILKECTDQTPLTQADMDALANDQKTDNVKCVFACALKKTGMMDDKGKFSAEGIRKSTQKYLSDDPELLQRTEQFIETCKTVNDAPVTDGEKGCDRALLIYDCTVKEAPNAMTEEEMKVEFTKLIMKCTKDHPVEMSELMLLQQLVVPKKKETKCLLACAYKTEGVMTAAGLYDIDHAYKIAELTKNGSEKRLENAKKMADICVKVNEVAVTDGEKGCERAGLIFKCTLENAPKFGFKI